MTESKEVFPRSCEIFSETVGSNNLKIGDAWLYREPKVASPARKTHSALMKQLGAQLSVVAALGALSLGRVAPAESSRAVIGQIANNSTSIRSL